MNQSSQHLEDVVVDPGYSRVKNKDVARAHKEHVVDQSYLDCGANHTKESKVCDDYSLNLDEGRGHVVPNVDEIKNGIADELSEIWVRLESTRQSHEPFSLLLEHFKLETLTNPVQDNKGAGCLRVQIY